MNANAIKAIREIKRLDIQAISEVVAALSCQINKVANSHLQAHKNAVEMLDDLVLYLTDEIAADEAFTASQIEEDARCAA
jgi:hypothetical protein